MNCDWVRKLQHSIRHSEYTKTSKEIVSFTLLIVSLLCTNAVIYVTSTNSVLYTKRIDIMHLVYICKCLIVDSRQQSI